MSGLTTLSQDLDEDSQFAHELALSTEASGASVCKVDGWWQLGDGVGVHGRRVEDTPSRPTREAGLTADDDDAEVPARACCAARA